MVTHTRASGITVETRGGAAVVRDPDTTSAPWRVAVCAGCCKRRWRAAAATVPPMTDEEAVVNAMEGQELDLVDAIPLS